MKREFNYQEVGATRGELPTGFDYLDASRLVGRGQELFAECAETIMTWGIQSGAGFKVGVPGRVFEGAENRLGLHWGPFRTTAHCKVVYVIDEPNRKGFAYGTVFGHPERGEESFVVELRPNGDVVFVIRAFSQPAKWFAKVAGSSVRWLQQHVTWKYLDAVHSPKVQRQPLEAAFKRTVVSMDGSASVSTS